MKVIFLPTPSTLFGWADVLENSGIYRPIQSQELIDSSPKRLVSDGLGNIVIFLSSGVVRGLSGAHRWDKVQFEKMDEDIVFRPAQK